MKILIGLIVLVLIFGLGILTLVLYDNFFNSEGTSQIDQSPKNSASLPESSADLPPVSVVAQGLDTPWGIAFLPDSSMLVTERAGRVRLIDKSGNLQSQPVATLPNVKEIGEGGLLGITLHPDFVKNNYVYLYYTYGEAGNNTMNKVVRMTYQNGGLTDEQVIVDQIPGSSNHNGGRIKFGPDKNLYITTGDAENPSQAQNTQSLAGKILRVTDQGKPVSENPFNNLVYSYGHRNPQGITWDGEQRLWETEHGRSGVLSGLDELNLITLGNNYGWPDIQGDEAAPGMVSPIKNSGNTTWAPAGLAFYDNALYFGGLRGTALYRADLQNQQIGEAQPLFKGQYGRIREVILGPDNFIYITTSNKDGRGIPSEVDDRIVKINPQKL
jgi:aldose sugar dehydrogenase